MYSCNQCYKSYAWKDSLKRHTRKMHDDEDSTADSESSMSMETDEKSCGNCGALFNSLSSLSKHAEKCEYQDSDSDVSGESDDESALKAVIEDVYKCTDSRYQAKVASYLAAGDENAAQTARDEMRPLYKRIMREVLKQYLVFGIEIKKSEHYKKLMKDIYHYKDEKGYEIKTAVKKALLKNGNMLEEVLEDVSSGNTDDGEDNGSDVNEGGV